VISVEVDDKDPRFAADLANAHEGEVTKLLGRLAVSEAQLRRVFFEKQLNDTKENLVKAEVALQKFQEKSGVILLDKQAEALITGAAMVRAQITEREVQLKVLRTSSTEQNPVVMRLNSELAALRAELARMDSSQGGEGSAVEMPVGRLPEAAVEYVRARRELKLQETLLESMIRQFEIAKLDEAKEGPALQQVDVAVPPDHKSKPSRALIVVVGMLLAFLLGSVWVIGRRYGAMLRATHPDRAAVWKNLLRAWGFARARS
jgi:tyrosine-protein kinase Etk/Wzc